MLRSQILPRSLRNLTIKTPVVEVRLLADTAGVSPACALERTTSGRVGECVSPLLRDPFLSPPLPSR